MREWIVSILVFFAFWCAFSSPALADELFFGQRERTNHPKFGTVELAVLYRPLALPQVVVFDNEGYLLAASPQSRGFIIGCDHPAEFQTCRVYDGVQGLMYEPDVQLWERGRTVEMDGRAFGDGYGSYSEKEYGFSQRPATFIEKVSFDAKGVVEAPVVSLLHVLWWVVALSFVARPLWRWRRAWQQSLPLSPWSIALGFVSSLPFWSMCYLATLVWQINPYSVYFFCYVFVTGGLIAVALTRPKAVV
ncbi:hypothetical protein [uncultured Pelagimonas sp.]|uniref:hypothetical protein n=1 Tax=uncultured Pelagimonas sp. TaxID=1618102 RepID=UPI00261E2A6C|nr:hypothetical protein [uncultured Pelagimonas sp.]